MDEEALLHGSESSFPASRLSSGSSPQSPTELLLLKRHKGLLRLKKWVAEHGALSLTLECAAELACLSPHHFSTAFHKHAGMTFKQWRHQVRVRWAVNAIETAQYSINEVIHLTGYRDRRAFERAVKRLTGTTPGQIRRKADGSELRHANELRSEAELEPQRP